MDRTFAIFTLVFACWTLYFAVISRPYFFASALTLTAVSAVVGRVLRSRQERS